MSNLDPASLPPFDLYPLPRLSVGVGKIAELPSLVAPLGSSILVVHNGSEGPVERVREVLKRTSTHLAILRNKGEPTVADVDRAVAAARGSNCTGIIAVGGGSAIDLAKAAAGVLANGGSALDYMEVIGAGKKLSLPALPWIAVPTTAGTGAEVTRNAVVGEPAKQFKASLRSEHLLPRAAIIDPSLGVDVPATVTAFSGMDALCQCVEAYLSNGANPFTDAIALKGAALAARSIRRAFADGADLDARTDLAVAALFSGVALTNAGLGAVHGFAAPVGANFPAPHGAVCAALLPHVMSANADAALAADENDPMRDRTLAKLATLGRLFGGAGDELGHVDPATAAGIAVDWVEVLTRDLAIPPLSQFGLKESNVGEMVALARKASSMKFNPFPLTDVVLGNVLRNAIR